MLIKQQFPLTIRLMGALDFFRNCNPVPLHSIFKELVNCIEKGLEPASDEVQKIIKKHHAFVEQIHSATQEVYKAMAQLYTEHPEFRKQSDPFHPELAFFMAEAMKIFADRELV